VFSKFERHTDYAILQYFDCADILGKATLIEQSYTTKNAKSNLF